MEPLSDPELPPERPPHGEPALRRRIIGLALPALGTLAIEPLYVLVDTAIVGRLGTPQLAGLGIASTILLTAVSLATALEYGLTSDVAFAHGGGDPLRARQAATDGLTLAVGAGVIVGAVVGFGARPLAWALHGRGEVLEHATTYLRIAAVGIPFVLVTFVGHGVMRGLNQLRVPLYIVLAANVANVILEIVAVYVLHWGVAGSAWATTLVQACACFAFLSVIREHLDAHRSPWARLGPMLVSGMHFAVRSLSMYAVWNLSTFIAARVDAPTLAANQVITQLFMFLAFVLDALAIPAQSLVAGALGSGEVRHADRVGRLCTSMSLWAGAVIAALLAIASPFVGGWFSDDPAVHQRVLAGVLIVAAMQFPGAIAFALDGALIGAQDERWLAAQAIRNVIAFAPLAVATLLWPSWGIVGLWAAQAAWMSYRAWVNARRWRTHAGQGFATVMPGSMPAVTG